MEIYAKVGRTINKNKATKRYHREHSKSDRVIGYVRLAYVKDLLSRRKYMKHHDINTVILRGFMYGFWTLETVNGVDKLYLL